MLDSSKTLKLAESAYRVFRSKESDDIYFGSAEFAEKILLDIAEILKIDPKTLNGEQSYNLISMYALCIILVDMDIQQKEIASYLMRQFPRYITERDQAVNIARYTGITLLTGESVFWKDKEEYKRALEAANREESSSDKKDEDGYYFETADEMAIYGKFHTGSVVWKRGGKYIDAFKKGFSLYEKGEFKKAAILLKECLRSNPIGISARFELAECYIQMKNFISAEAALFAMHKYLTQSIDKARFYRRLGFIYSELENYLLGAACYIYSERFCKHPSVAPELEFIESMSDINMNSVRSNPLLVLNNFNIPLLPHPKKA